MSRFETDFWPWYHRAHRRLETRIAHALATLACAGFTIAALATGQLWLAALGPFADHLISQLSHRLWEKNVTRPWSHPLMHARAELRLFASTLHTLGALALRRVRHHRW